MRHTLKTAILLMPVIAEPTVEVPVVERHWRSWGRRVRVVDLLLAAALLLALLIPITTLADDNLRTCLDGRYPSLCDKSRLAPDQRQRAEVAELRANLETCLSGKYTSLCRHQLLTPDETRRVEEAERRENLRVCLLGKYTSLCQHRLLTANDAGRVREAERRENLRVCLTGKYKSLCDHAQLSISEAQSVEAAERAENRLVCLSGQYPGLCEKRLLSEEDQEQAQAAEAAQASSIPARAERQKPAENRQVPHGRSVACVESSIMKPTPFMGNSGEVFVLLDGSVWEVGAGEYNYLYEYYPNVTICGFQLSLDNQTLDVMRIR